MEKCFLVVVVGSGGWFQDICVWINGMPGTEKDIPHGIVLLFVKLQKIYSFKRVSEMFIITCGHRYKYTTANLFAGAENDEYFGFGVRRPYPLTAKGYLENQTVHKKGSVEMFSSICQA